jgi:RHS repeat-associated protein
MENNTNNRCFSLNKRIVSFLHHIALIAMLHSSFVAPAQGILEAYMGKEEPLSYLGNGYNNDIKSNNDTGQKTVQSSEASSKFETTVSKVNSTNGSYASVSYSASADIKEGIIGISKDRPLDSPSDNLFKVNLEQLPMGYDKVYLTYEVFGLADHHSVARSINDRLSVGGYLIKQQQGWSVQKEEINSSWLHKGENTVLFTTPKGADYQYRIRNLSIEVVKNNHVNAILVVHEHAIALSKDNKLYIKGFLRGNYPEARVEVSGTYLQVSNNEFEGYVTLNEEMRKNKFMVIKCTDKNELLGQELLFIDNVIEADKIFPLERKEQAVSKLFKSCTSSRLDIEGAGITANDSALVKDFDISVSRLRNIDVAPMESGMINVTKGGKGYRFLPDGTRFESPVSLSIAYDSLLIPTGYTEKDVKTYYFDTKSKRWVAVHKDSIDVKNNMIISRTTHFTDYINGIIQAPDSPETSAFTPTMMSDVKAADPSAEMTLISPPSASQKGDANISYPIKIPAGRRGMQPQLGLQYSNEGGNSWLGLGWNLNVPALSIDTRWGVPLFDTVGETEIYSLNGEQLMYDKEYLPHRHQETNGIISTAWQSRNTSGTKVFYPRKQGSFAKIERLGNTPQTYYWKVTNTDGTISWYGGKTPDDVAANKAVLKDSNQRIVHWALFMVEDVYGNNMRYTYETFVNNTSTSNLYQGQQLYLTKINYTGFGNDSGNYDVEFLRKTSRPDVNISARLGIKQVDFHLLDMIKISYQGSVLRSYKLNYITGRFSKTLLNSVAELDGKGNEFYRHNFDYYDDIKQSNGTDVYFSAEIEEQICAELPPVVPDTDHDGVPDSIDWCITLPGSASNNGCPENETPYGPSGPTGTDPVTGQKLYCYEVMFKLPLKNQRYQYTTRYDLNGSVYNTLCEYTPAIVGGLTINGNYYTAPANLYMSHYDGTSLVNLCPSYTVTATQSNPDPVIQNPYFATQFKSWLETQVLTSFLDSNSNLTVMNKSGLFKVGSYLITSSSYEFKFQSIANLTGSISNRSTISAQGVDLPFAIDGSQLSPTNFNLHEDFASLKSAIEAIYGGTVTLQYALSSITVPPLYLSEYNATLKFHNVLQPMSNITIGSATYNLGKCKDPSHPGHQAIAAQFSQANSFVSDVEEDTYNITFDASVPIGDPDCPSLLNIDFLLQGDIPSYNSAASLLGSSKTKGYNWGASIGLGIGCKPWTKNTTLGRQKTFSFDKSDSFTTMIDIDGDGLDDSVFKGYSGALYYRKHNVERVYENGQLKIKHTYSPAETITGINNFYKANSSSDSDNFQVTFGFSRLGGFAGLDKSEARSETNVYFTDANGDGLPDIVKNGTVFFNRIQGGKPEFVPNSMNSPNLVIKAAPRTIEVPAEYNQSDIKIPDYDIVKVWEAPYRGIIAITNDIVLTDPSQEVTVTIETRIKELSSGIGCLIYGKVLNSSNPEIHSTITNTTVFGGSCINYDSVDSIGVIPGQLVFFRVHATASGTNPKINWDPKVEYLNLNPVLDQNGLATHNYQYSQDFLLAQINRPVIFPGNGSATLTWDAIAVNAPSDDVTFEIYKTEITTGANGDVENSNSNDQIIYKRFCPAGANTLVSPLTNDISGVISNITISSNDSPGSNNTATAFYFKIKADSNVNWKQIEWKPKVNCITEETVIGVDNTPEGTVTTNETFYGIPNVTLYKVFNKEADDYTYSADTYYPEISTLNTSVGASGLPLYILPHLDGVFSSTDNGTMKFVVKRDGVAIDRREIYINNGSVSFNNSSPIYIGLAANDKLEIGFYTDDSNSLEDQPSLLSKLYPPDQYSSMNVVKIAAGNWTSGPSEFFTNRQVCLFHIPASQKFGPMYRQWGQFAYNPSLVQNATSTPFGDLIHASVLEIQPDSNQLQAAVDELEGYGENITVENLEAFESQYQSMFSSMPFLAMYAKREVVNNELSEKWFGSCPQSYVSALSYRAAGMNEIRDDYVDPDDFVVQEVLETGAYGISKYTKGKSRNISAGASLGIGGEVPTFNVGASVSKSIDAYSNSLTDYIDINGDRYPDIVTKDEVQYTIGTGGLLSSVLSNSAITGVGGSYPTKSTNSNLGFAASGSYSFGGKSNGSGSGDGMDKPRFHGFKGNNGAGISGNFSTGKSSTARMWADINGDGLADMLEKDPDNITVRLNLGNNVYQSMQANASSWGFTEMFNSSSKSYGGGIGFNKWNGSVELGLSLGSGRNNVKNTLVDINGDGIADMVRSDNGLFSDGLTVGINSGNGFMPEKNWSSFNMNHESETNMSSKNLGLTFAFTIPIPIISICLKLGAFNTNGSDFTSTNRTKKSISDFDGDGFPDLIKEISNNTIRVQYSNIRRTNMLKSVENPLGGKFTVDYDVILPTYDNPDSKWVLKSVVVEDGFNLVNDGVDTYNKSFEYEKGYYDRREREFYGFGTVKVIDNVLNDEGEVTGVYRTNISEFHNKSYYLNGLTKWSYMIRGNDETKILSRTINNYKLRKLTNTGLIDLTALQVPLTFDTGGSEGRRAAAVILESTENYIYEFGETPLRSRVEFTYDDARGRITKYDYKGDITVAEDNYTAQIAYYQDSGLEAKNIYNIPGTIVVKDYNGDERRRRIVSTLDPATGSILSVWANLAADWAKTNMTYDQYGNLDTVVLPKNDNGQTFTYYYSYDTNDFKYPIEIKDSFGYVSLNEYDARFDKPIRTTDIAGNNMEYVYDSFSRVLIIRAPKEIQNDRPYTISFGYYPKYDDLKKVYDCIDDKFFMPVAVTSHYDPQHQGNDIQTYTFIDGIGRPVQVKKDIELNNGSNDSPDLKEAVSVSGKVFYDQYGRGIKQYHPYFENKECASNLVRNEHESEYFASTDYDEADRGIKMVDPEGNTSLAQFSIGDDFNNRPALKTKSITDQNGSQSITSESFTDVNGRVTSTLNVLTGTNTADLWTRFNYNGIGELMSYTDAENLSTTYKYDQLGRKVEIVHPDNGKTSYAYDNYGNITKLQTANLAADTSLQPADRYIKYYYDYNRIDKIVYPDAPSGQNISNVYYKYGASGNNKGRLVEQEDATGVQYFEYGNMGEVINNTRIVVGPNIPTRTFTTSFDYDSWNRVNTITYPDGEVVNHEYNLGGNLVKMSGTVEGSPYDYIARIDYDYFEQRTYLLYGNGTDMVYDYTPALRRLNTMVARTSSQQNFLDNTYKYDKVGNITELINTAGPNDNNAMGGSFAHNYEYDNMNRLTGAIGSFTGDSSQQQNNNDYISDYSLTMAYNTTHGILEKKQEHNKNGQAFVTNTYQNGYEYNSGTHQVKRITDANNTSDFDDYKYDRNGNIDDIYDKATGATRHFFWDESNRLRAIRDELSMQHYIYDASGERVLKASAQPEELYNNGVPVDGSLSFDSYTTYPSAYIVINPNGKFSKHYYAGSQRVVSRIGDQDAGIFDYKSRPGAATETTGDGDDKEAFSEDKLRKQQVSDLTQILKKAEMGTPVFKKYKLENEEEADTEEENIKGQTVQRRPEGVIYFYHPDHLGTSTFLTDFNGELYQFYINLPFGETMAEQHSQTADYETPYKFNGKELDSETGLYYYGARYYDPRASIWLSTDPLMEKFPNINPYVYCYQNPINIIDPTGMAGVGPGEKGDDCGDGGGTPNLNIYIRINDDSRSFETWNDGDWHGVSVNNLKEANAYLEKYLKGSKAKTIVLDHHGSDITYKGDNSDSGQNQMQTGKGATQKVYSEDFTKYNDANAESDFGGRTLNKSDVTRLIKMNSYVEKGGDFILMACMSGEDRNIGSNFSKLTSHRTNLYFSNGLCKVRYGELSNGDYTTRTMFDITMSGSGSGFTKYSSGTGKISSIKSIQLVRSGSDSPLIIKK